MCDPPTEASLAGVIVVDVQRLSVATQLCEESHDLV